MQVAHEAWYSSARSSCSWCLTDGSVIFILPLPCAPSLRRLCFSLQVTLQRLKLRMHTDYVVRVVALNNAGMTTAVQTDRFQVDLTPPVCRSGDGAPDAPLIATEHYDVLPVWWQCWDPESGVAAVHVSAGTTEMEYVDLYARTRVNGTDNRTVVARLETAFAPDADYLSEVSRRGCGVWRLSGGRASADALPFALPRTPVPLPTSEAAFPNGGPGPTNTSAPPSARAVRPSPLPTRAGGMCNCSCRRSESSGSPCLSPCGTEVSWPGC